MPELRDCRVLITGGAGLVGSHIADRLIALGASEVVLLDNMERGSERNIEDALRTGKARLVVGDIRDKALLSEVARGCDCCFHMAALRITQCAADPEAALTVMYDGYFNVLATCVASNIKKLVVASSASIYGHAENFPTSETHHPYNNRTLYGAAKAAGELMCRSFFDMHGLDYVALRYFNIYGPRMDTTGRYTEVLVRWYDTLRHGDRPRIFGAGDQTMDFVHVVDVARASVQAMQIDVTDEVFNVATGVEVSLRELCRTLIEVMGAGVEPEFVPLPTERQNVEVGRRLADTTKARGVLGFESAIDLRAGLADLVQWLDGHAMKVS